MTDDQIDDLKQFIATTVRNEVSSQIDAQTTDLKTEFGELKTEFGELKTEFGQLKTAFGRLEQKVDNLEIVTNTIAGAVGVRFDEHNDQLSNHETRITTLEAHPAGAY